MEKSGPEAPSRTKAPGENPGALPESEQPTMFCIQIKFARGLAS